VTRTPRPRPWPALLNSDLRAREAPWRREGRRASFTTPAHLVGDDGVQRDPFSGCPLLVGLSSPRKVRSRRCAPQQH